MKKVFIIVFIAFVLGGCSGGGTQSANDGYSRTNSGLAWTAESGSEGTPTYLAKSQKNKGYDINIKVPKVVENPSFVPFTIKLGRPIDKNSMLDVYSNGQLAYRINPKNDVEIMSLSGRVRTKEYKSTISAKIYSVDFSGNKKEILEAKSTKYKSTAIAATPPVNDNNKEHKTAFYKGEFKIKIYNNLGGKIPVGLDLVTSKGLIYAGITPAGSGYEGNKYLTGFMGIKGNFDTGSVIKIRTNNN